MIYKTVNVEVKMGLRSNIIAQNLDTRCLRRHCLSYNTFSKMQTQSSKDFFCTKKPKTKDPKLALPCIDMVKPLKPGKKNKKKKTKKHMQDNIGEWKKQSLATSNSVANVSKRKKKCDGSKIRCFNSNKKSYYASICTEFPKSQCQSQQFLC